MDNATSRWYPRRGGHCTWQDTVTQIEHMTSQCHTCAGNQSTRKFSAWPKSLSSWQHVHTDFAGPFRNIRWLIVVDSYSKFPIAVPMNSAMSHSTVQALFSIFCLEDLPEAIVSDNGPQFTSNKSETFCECNGIQHLTSAPFHSQTNGKVERFVRTFKQQMAKCCITPTRDQALQLLLISYHSHPQDGPSLAELLHGCHHWTLFHLLQPPQHLALKEGLKYPFALHDIVFFWVFSSSRRWVKDSRILRTAQPQQPPEGVIITQHDDPMEVEPSPPLPPLILAMELDPSSYRWS
ncbi:uncharacterized protein K02A2.6-like isoform X1 [Schistocerca gregaria]|uniref:uncharacterized protein K02A2.6-like isoform X1 n=1 Tax=Schistocerca gregaria TaxID=7010 RepID=UPI00211E329A|nr:uncharacterized protein K02A2.6-like isoform X1 [Schistocerca gregaria]